MWVYGMRNWYDYYMRKFTIILSLTVIGLLLLGIYWNSNAPSSAKEVATSTLPQQDGVSIDSSKNINVSKSKWIGNNYLSIPEEVKKIGSVSLGKDTSSANVITKEGQEIWSLRIARQSNGEINKIIIVNK